MGYASGNWHLWRWFWGQCGQLRSAVPRNPSTFRTRANKPQSSNTGAIPGHLRGNRIPFGFTFNEDVVSGVNDVVLHRLLGDGGGLRHCKANGSSEMSCVRGRSLSLLSCSRSHQDSDTFPNLWSKDFQNHKQAWSACYLSPALCTTYTLHQSTAGTRPNPSCHFGHAEDTTMFT